MKSRKEHYGRRLTWHEASIVSASITFAIFLYIGTGQMLLHYNVNIAITEIVLFLVGLLTIFIIVKSFRYADKKHREIEVVRRTK